jgi:hypothetical protein
VSILSFDPFLLVTPFCLLLSFDPFLLALDRRYSAYLVRRLSLQIKSKSAGIDYAVVGLENLRGQERAPASSLLDMK